MSQDRDKPSFLRHAAVYGIGNFMLYAVNFLLLPLYTRYLQPNQFGTLEVLHRFGEILVIILLFGALRQGAMTFFRQSADDTERQQVIGSALILLLIINAFGAVLLIGFAQPIGVVFSVDDPMLLRLALAVGLLEGSYFFLLGLSQSRIESGFIVTVNLSQLILKVLLCVLFVAGFHWGIRGVLLGAVLSSGTFVLGLTLREVLRGPLSFRGEQVLGLLKFIVPFLPSGLCLFVLNRGDQFLIQRWAGEAEVGIYSLGYRLASVVAIFAVSPLMMVWAPRMYEVAKEPDAPDIFGRAVARIIAAHVFLGLGVCIFADEAIMVLGGQAYAASARVVPPIMLASFFLVNSMLMESGLYIRRKTIFKSVIAFAATVIVLGFYLLLIPRYGGMGAAIATIGGFACQAVISRNIVQRIFPVRYQDGRMLAVLLLAVALWLTSRTLPDAVWLIPAKAVLWLLWPALLWTTGLISPQEKGIVLNTLRRGLKRFPPLPLGERGSG